jgi:hypothetical protein
MAIDGRGAPVVVLGFALPCDLPGAAFVHMGRLCPEPFGMWLGGPPAPTLLSPFEMARASITAHDRPGAVRDLAGYTTVSVAAKAPFLREPEGLLDASIWIQAGFSTIRKRATDLDVRCGVNESKRLGEASWETSAM